MALVVKNPPANAEGIREMGQEDPLEEGIQPTPIFLPGESHGQRNLLGYSPWDHKESYMVEVTLQASISLCVCLLNKNKTPKQ